MLAQILGLSISKKVLNKTSTDKSSPSLKKIKKTAVNFMAVTRAAKDLNIIRQNIIKLVEIYGGKPTEKEDAHFLKDDERERKFKVLQEKFIKSQAPSEDDEGSSKGKLFKKFKSIIKNLRVPLTGFKNENYGIHKPWTMLYQYCFTQTKTARL